MTDGHHNLSKGSVAGISLRSRLYKALIFPLILLVLVDSFIGYEMAHRFAAQAYDDALQLAAEDTWAQLQASTSEDLAGDRAIATLFSANSNQGFARALIGSTGELRLGKAIPPPSNSDSRVVPSKDSGNQWLMYEGFMDARPVRVIQIPIGVKGIGILRIAEDSSRRVELEHLIHSLVLGPQLILFAALLWIIHQAIRHGLMPMRGLRRKIASLKVDDRLIGAPGTIPAEVEPLVAAIDQLLDRLRAARGLQDRFLGDAAHQLKTPLAALMAHCELLQKSNLDPDQRARLAKMQEGSQRLSRMLNQLLAYLRNSPQSLQPLALQPVNLSSLISDAALDWAPVAVKNEQDFGVHQIAKDQWICADPIRLREMFDNLIDNAIRYSPPRSAISISLFAEPNILVCIEDSAAVLTEPESIRIFERFYRIPGSSTDGSGLGLAIVQDIAFLHGAEVRVRPALQSSGNCFEVKFPKKPVH